MVFKSLNGTAPSYMADMFNYTGDSHCRQTRAASRKDLSVQPGIHKDIYVTSFVHSSIDIWNSLHVNL